MAIIKSNPQSFTYQSSYYQANAHSGGTLPRQTTSWINTTSGVPNPRYKSLIRDGGNATTDFSGSQYEVIDPVPHNFSCYFGPPYKDTERFKGFVLKPIVTPGTPNFTSADNAALGKFYTSARNAISSMKGMTFLGELAETIHMIKHPGETFFSGIGSYLDRLKKVNPGLPLRQRRKILADTYLEYVFGWLPLISDMKDALKAFEALRSKKEIIRVSGFGNQQTMTENTSYGSVMISSLNPTIETLVTTGETQVRYYGAVHGTASLPSTQAALKSFGFKLDEFVPTAWELLPWSFLIDYFTNIGDIVSATCFVNSQLAWCSKTTRYEVVRKYNSMFDAKVCASSNPFPTYQGGGDSSSSWTVKYTAVNRIASVQPTVPSLEFSLPGSKTRWANIAALALQSSALSRLFH
jgi:hypothetical protein